MVDEQKLFLERKSTMKAGFLYFVAVCLILLPPTSSLNDEGLCLFYISSPTVCFNVDCCTVTFSLLSRNFGWFELTFEILISERV